MKTFSVAILKETEYHGKVWYTNFGQYHSLDDINWDEVYDYVMNDDRALAYGYYYGHNSRNLVSNKFRTEVFRKLGVDRPRRG